MRKNCYWNFNKVNNEIKVAFTYSCAKISCALEKIFFFPFLFKTYTFKMLNILLFL
jgi:hypothetical protein